MSDSGERDLWRRADRVLDELLTLPPADRAMVLEEMGLEPEAEARVRRLLGGAELSDGLLDRPAADLLGTGEEAAASLLGRRLGPFELEEEIGRGGMSVVFRARRVDGQFEQQVALKLLTIAQIASSSRIRQEKEILASLRHPHISTLVDGGVDADGTPWLAMELVDGEPIDHYCEHHGLDARSVVELFLDVCDAVAYAHRNLVVHRDLKPGNILVDSDGEVRLLDFGIAKLLAEGDSGATQTRAFTPRYAAPEQFAGDKVTTATDVYGLGGVLYRLLSGETPRPDAGDTSPLPDTTADPGRPSRTDRPVPGIDRDLDTVVLKALRPEADRRYPSAAELREDLELWLQRRPVRAIPDSLGYRLRKLFDRRRAAVVSGALLLLVLAGGVATTLWQAERAREQAAVATREAERATAVTDFLLDLFQFAEPDRSQGERLTVRETLDVGARQLQSRLADQPEVRSELLGTVGEIYRRLALYDEAAPLLDEAVRVGSDLGGAPEARARLRRAALAASRAELGEAEVDLEIPLQDLDIGIRSSALNTLGEVRRAQGRFEEATAALEEGLELEANAAEPDLERIAQLRLALADTYFQAGDLDRAGELLHQALADARAAHPGDHTDIATILQSLGIHAAELADFDSALGYLEEALEMRERLLGDSHPDIAFTLSQIAQVHRVSGRFDEAEALYRRALELQRNRLGEEHPKLLSTLNSLALLAYDRGDVEQAAELLDDLIPKVRRAYGEEHPVLADILVNLAAIRRVLGHYDRAERHLQEALAINRKGLGPETLAVGHCYAHLGNLEQARGRLDLAEEYYLQALAATRAAAGDEHPETLSIRANLGSLSFSSERYAEAAERFGEAWSIAQGSLAEEHPIRILVESRFARALLYAGRGKEALDHGERAAAMASRLYAAEHPRRLEIEATLAAAQIEAGDRKRGERLMADVASRLEAGAASGPAAQEVARWRRAPE